MTVIDPTRFVGSLERAGITLFVGVPDSLMRALSSALASSVPAQRHLIAANEGNAIAMAMGHTLVSGRPALVYLQNSGLGNTVNPLLSLVDPEVYGVPMVLLIGWRGEPGVADEPQHVKQGRITPALLETMEIPFEELDATLADADADAAVRRAVAEAVRRSGPVAILVRKGAFGPAEHVLDALALPADERPTREAALARIAEVISDDAIVVSTTGMLSRELFELRVARGGGALDLLTVGGMGHASSIALGAALTAESREVWCLDGDGALLMHLGALPVIARAASPNLRHVVFNNEVHDSVGGQPTAIDVVDIPSLASAAGYRWAGRAETLDAVDASAAALCAVGPTLLEITVRPGNRDDLGRPNRTPGEARALLQQSLGVSPFIGEHG